MLGLVDVVAHPKVDLLVAAAEHHPQAGPRSDQHQKEDRRADETFSLAARSSFLGVCLVILVVIKGAVRGGERISCFAGLALRDASWAVVSPVVISG